MVKDSKKTRRVAIVARHPKSRYLAPLNDEAWEIWTLSPFDNGDTYTDLPRWDRFYELHSEAHLESEVAGAWKWLEEQKAAGKTVIFQADYPLQEIVDKYKEDYFTNSISYMIAHALLEGVDELAIYGVDMSHEAEYAWQRPNVEYWLARLKHQGCKVTVPDQSDLIKHTWRYGFETGSPMIKNLLARKSELEQRIAHCEQQLEINLKHAAGMMAAHGELGDIQGRINGEMTEELLQHFKSRKEELEHAIKANQREYEEVNTTLLMLRGCLEENKYHQKII